jgi:hypothetical protein
VFVDDELLVITDEKLFKITNGRKLHSFLKKNGVRGCTVNEFTNQENFWFVEDKFRSSTMKMNCCSMENNFEVQRWDKF